MTRNSIIDALQENNSILRALLKETDPESLAAMTYGKRYTENIKLINELKKGTGRQIQHKAAGPLFDATALLNQYGFTPDAGFMGWMQRNSFTETELKTALGKISYMEQKGTIINNRTGYLLKTLDRERKKAQDAQASATDQGPSIEEINAMLPGKGRRRK